MGRTRALRNVKEVELKDIPKLTKCGLVTAFKCVESVKMENVSKLGDLKALKEAVERKKVEEEERRKKREEEEQRRKEAEEAVMRRKEEKERKRRAVEEERLRKEREEAAAMAKKKVVISCKMDWDCVDKHVGVIEVSDGCCNEEGLKELDLSGFVNLRELKVGNECFSYVDEVKLIGLSELESVEIGSQSLTRIRSEDDMDKEKDLRDQIGHNRHFYLKNCPKLKSLKFGRWSCLDYSVIEIENVDALEVIEIGDLDEDSYCFYYASLELKSILIHSE